MKKIFAFLACCLLLQSIMITPASAVAADEANATCVSREVIDLGDGITAEDELYVSNNRLMGRDASRTRTIRDNGTVIAVITIKASFRFDGETVWTFFKMVSQKDTYHGWKYVEDSFLCNGGRVTLEGKISKLLVMNIPFTLTITCDKNGNIS